MLKLNSIMIGSEKPSELAAFYEKVLERKPNYEEGDWFGFDAGGCSLSIGSHDKVKGNSVNPERMILNLETSDTKAEFERLKALGATVVAEPYQMEGWEGSWIATLADPDGNYFQLMPAWESEEKA